MNVKEIREKTGLSQSNFAKKYGIPVRTLQGWEAGRKAPDYILEMIAKNVALDEIELKAWFFSEYRDRAGTGATKMFKDRDEAVRYAEDVWLHLNAHDQESYKTENGDWFMVAELPVVWDDDELDFEPVFEEWDPYWTAL